MKNQVFVYLKVLFFFFSEMATLSVLAQTQQEAPYFTIYPYFHI